MHGPPTPPTQNSPIWLLQNLFLPLKGSDYGLLKKCQNEKMQFFIANRFPLLPGRKKTPKKAQHCQNSKNCPRSTFRGDPLLGRSIFREGCVPFEDGFAFARKLWRLHAGSRPGGIWGQSRGIPRKSRSGLGCISWGITPMSPAPQQSFGSGRCNTFVPYAIECSEGP